MNADRIEALKKWCRLMTENPHSYLADTDRRAVQDLLSLVLLLEDACSKTGQWVARAELAEKQRDEAEARVRSFQRDCGELRSKVVRVIAGGLEGNPRSGLETLRDLLYIEGDSV